MAQAGMGRLLYRGNRCHLVSVRSKVQNRRHPATRLCRARVAGTCCIGPRAGCRRAAALVLRRPRLLSDVAVLARCRRLARRAGTQARRQVKVDECLEAAGDLDSGRLVCCGSWSLVLGREKKENRLTGWEKGNLCLVLSLLRSFLPFLPFLPSLPLSVLPLLP